MASSKLFEGKITREELNSLVDKAADLIRNAVDYKFILVLLFLKRLNDQWRTETQHAVERLMKDADMTEAEARKEAENETYHTVNIPPKYLWQNMVKDVKNLPENFANSISQVAKLNKELQGVVDRVDFLGFASNQENRELLRQLIELFNRYDFSNGNVEPDALGDAYEHVVMRFAPEKAKEGEIYTPREVIMLLVNLLAPEPGESVYDPACGSGGMLIGAYHYVLEKYGPEKARELFLFGEEFNPVTFALCRMNLMLHGIRDAEIENGNTLMYPKFKDNGKLKPFDNVIANPPWNQDGYGEETLRKSEIKERFSFGFSPRTNADWAWIQHMLASSRKEVGIVLDANALHRGNSEERIRTQIVEKDWIECIILLPEKLFYNTPSSGILITFNKNKTPERKGKIIFVNAVTEFEKHPSVRRLNTLSQKNIERLVDVFESFASADAFSRVVDLQEVRGNEYDLNVTRYVSSVMEDEEIDLTGVSGDMRRVSKQSEEIQRLVDGYVDHAVAQLSQKSKESNFKHSEELDLEIPKGWKVVRVRDLFDVYTGSTPSTKVKKYWDAGTINWITPQDLSNLGDSIFIGSSERRLTETAIREHSLSVLEKGAIVLSTRAPVGYVAVLAKESTFNQGCKGLASKADAEVVPEFYCYYFSRIRNRLEDLSSGSTFIELSKDDLEKLWVPNPPESEQKKIARTLSTMDEGIQKERQKVADLMMTKKWFMQNLLHGSIEPR